MSGLSTNSMAFRSDGLVAAEAAWVRGKQTIKIAHPCGLYRISPKHLYDLCCLSIQVHEVESQVDITTDTVRLL